jgi:hypothetical protein
MSTKTTWLNEPDEWSDADGVEVTFRDFRVGDPISGEGLE